MQGIELSAPQHCAFVGSAVVRLKKESPHFPCGIYLGNEICVDFKLSSLCPKPLAPLVEGAILRGAGAGSILRGREERAQRGESSGPYESDS